MFRWCHLPLCILILVCMASSSCSSQIGHRRALSFSNSLRLTRSVRTRVQQLLSRYKQQVFGDELFESRELTLSTLPAVTVSYQTWRHMQDAERLRLASHYLQTFWTHLEGQRLQLQEDRGATTGRRGKRGRPQLTLSQSFIHLQVDLRDLMKQVNSQLNSLTVTQVSASTKSPFLHPPHSTSSSGTTPSMHHLSDSSRKLLSSQTTAQPTRTSTDSHSRAGAGTSQWVQHLRGYVILRDLERYLSRLARDYTVLQAKS